MWGLFILGLLVTCWSILAVQFIHYRNEIVAERGWYDGCIDCPTAFSSVMRSNLTFFQQILAGDSWGQVSKPIMIEFPETTFFFLAVWATLGLALANIILAAIVEAATDARADQEAEAAEELRRETAQAEQDLRQLCNAMDGDGSGNLSETEITQGCQEEEGAFAGLMHRLGIEQSDIELAFSTLDENRTGEVSYEELIPELMKLKHQSQELRSMMKLSLDLKFYAGDVTRQISDLLQTLRQDLLTQLRFGDGADSELGAGTKPLAKSYQNGISAEFLSFSVSSIDDRVRKQMLAMEIQLESSLSNLRNVLTDASQPACVNGAEANAKNALENAIGPGRSLPLPPDARQYADARVDISQLPAGRGNGENSMPPGPAG